MERTPEGMGVGGEKDFSSRREVSPAEQDQASVSQGRIRKGQIKQTLP